jgi:hypothetical protein
MLLGKTQIQNALEHSSNDNAIHQTESALVILARKDRT